MKQVSGPTTDETTKSPQISHIRADIRIFNEKICYAYGSNQNNLQSHSDNIIIEHFLLQIVCETKQ